MDNIKAIYVTKDKSWFSTRRYNGSWHPINMDTTDGLDHSIMVYESWYQFIDMMEEDVENAHEELTDQQVEEYFNMFIDHMENWGWEVKISN